MRTILTRISLPILAIFCLMAGSAPAAEIDGKWTGEMKMAAGRKQNREPRSIPVTLTLKADGAMLTGSIKAGAGKKAPSVDITNGQVQGERISFQTITKTKKGDQTVRWEGTLSGNDLKMTRQGQSRRAPATEFTLKRSES